MRFYYLFLLLPAVAFTASSYGSTKEETAPSFWHERERGWFWHEPTQVEEKVEEEEPPQPTNMPVTPESEETPELIPLDADWIEKNLPLLLRNAMNDPSTDNLAAYAYAQRLMIDMSSRFSTRMMEFMKLEPELSEEIRRPTSRFSLAAFQAETRNSVRDAMSKIGENASLWFFFLSDCNYCSQQIPIVKELARRYGTGVVAISLDGYSMPGMEDFDLVSDSSYQVADRLGVLVTPSIFVVDHEGSNFIGVTQGLSTLPEIESRLLVASRDIGILTQQEYLATTEVRDINVLHGANGVLMADSKKIETDSAYLADMLRAKIVQQEVFGQTRVRITE